jgi:hypothetical protein
VGKDTGYFSQSPEEFYRLKYFEAIDLATTSIKDRFDQPDYAMYRHLEEALVKGVSGEDISKQLHEISRLYTEIDISQFTVQLASMSTYFKTNHITVSLESCLKYLTDLSPAMQAFYSEVCKVARLLMVMPATNATSERSFSVMRRLKSYLRSTMGQSRLNHTMLLNIYKEQLDMLDLTVVANEFVSGSEHRLRFFGKF